MRTAAAALMAAALAPNALDPDPTTLAISAICAAEQPSAAATSGQVLILDQMGSGGFRAGGANAQAKPWLDYGLKLFHAFYYDEAKAAFRMAAGFDPGCALCAWGEALSLGSTLTYKAPLTDLASAKAAADRAVKAARTPLERDLAAALQRRYGGGEGAEAGYAREMAELAARYPDETDVAALAAHAMLATSKDNNPAAHAPAVALLQRALARAPDNTALIHYYIHATEDVGQPALALPYAERLPRLAPRASHLVHMNAHTLFQLGRYEAVAASNAEALKVEREFSGAVGYRGPIGDRRFYFHNIMYGVGGALMANDAALSLKYADHARVAFPEGSNPLLRSLILGRTEVAYGRFAPEKALALPEPGADETIHRIYWRYARGEALASRGDAAAVLRESQGIEAVQANPREWGVEALRTVAAGVLAGRAAMLSGDARRAAKLYAEAAAEQERTFGPVLDPPPWWYPVRRSVAAAWLKAGDKAQAAAAARASLAKWPGDALAQRVLDEAEGRTRGPRSAKATDLDLI